MGLVFWQGLLSEVAGRWFLLPPAALLMLASALALGRRSFGPVIAGVLAGVLCAIVASALLLAWGVAASAELGTFAVLFSIALLAMFGVQLWRGAEDRPGASTLLAVALWFGFIAGARAFLFGSFLTVLKPAGWAFVPYQLGVLTLELTIGLASMLLFGSLGVGLRSTVGRWNTRAPRLIGGGLLLGFALLYLVWWIPLR